MKGSSEKKVRLEYNLIEFDQHNMQDVRMLSCRKGKQKDGQILDKFALLF